MNQDLTIAVGIGAMRSSALLTAGIVAMILIAAQAAAAEKMPLELVRTIPMSGVEGRIDHMTADIQGHRLFVAALGNNTLEVLDVEQGKHLHTITGLLEPQGVAYLPRARRIVVANGKDGSCRFFDSQTYHPQVHRFKIGNVANHLLTGPLAGDWSGVVLFGGHSSHGGTELLGSGKVVVDQLRLVHVGSPVGVIIHCCRWAMGWLPLFMGLTPVRIC